MRRGALSSALIVTLAIACGSSETRETAESAPLPEGVAARVGEEEIATTTLARVARAQGVSPREARERAIAHALFAAYVKQHRRGSGWVETAERGALARSLLEAMKRDAERQGPPTAAEIEKASADYWVDVARPPLARTSHAVVLVDPSASPEARAKAKRLAEAIHAAVKDVRDGKELEERVKRVDKQGQEVKVEHLNPIAEDGREADPKYKPGSGPVPMFELPYARAAHALAEPGALSPVVETRFGYHVILLTERIPARQLSLEERRTLLAPEVMLRRAYAEYTPLVERLARTTPIAIDRAANDLMMRVQVGR